jgi:hypothetical protein
LRRSVGDFRATRRLRRLWEQEGRALPLPGSPAPAYAIRHPFPVVSVVGVLRPRLYVAEQVLERLSPSELRAVVAHEAGHLASLDNLKRLAAPGAGDALAGLVAPPGCGLGRGGRRGCGRPRVERPGAGLGPRQDRTPRPPGLASGRAGGRVPTGRFRDAPRQAADRGPGLRPRGEPAEGVALRARRGRGDRPLLDDALPGRGPPHRRTARPPAEPQLLSSRW